MKKIKSSTHITRDSLILSSKWINWRPHAQAYIHNESSLFDIQCSAYTRFAGLLGDIYFKAICNYFGKEIYHRISHNRGKELSILCIRTGLMAVDRLHVINCLESFLSTNYVIVNCKCNDMESVHSILLDVICSVQSRYAFALRLANPEKQTPLIVLMKILFSLLKELGNNVRNKKLIKSSAIVILLKHIEHMSPIVWNRFLTIMIELNKKMTEKIPDIRIVVASVVPSYLTSHARVNKSIASMVNVQVFHMITPQQLFDDVYYNILVQTDEMFLPMDCISFAFNLANKDFLGNQVVYISLVTLLTQLSMFFIQPTSVLVLSTDEMWMVTVTYCLLIIFTRTYSCLNHIR